MKPNFSPGDKVIVTDDDGDEYTGTVQPTQVGLRHDWYQVPVAIDLLDGEILVVDQKKIRKAEEK